MESTCKTSTTKYVVRNAWSVNQKVTIAEWAKLANLGSVLISVKNIFIKSQKYFGSFIIYFLKNILVK